MCNTSPANACYDEDVRELGMIPKSVGFEGRRVENGRDLISKPRLAEKPLYKKEPI